MSGPFPCPCCGYLTLQEGPGSYDICPICFWEDDNVQLRWPSYSGGANAPCLIDAQRSYAGSGAYSTHVLKYVVSPSRSDVMDDGWRPVDLHLDDFEPRGVHEAPWPDDLATLYYWRPTFWRSSGAGQGG